MRNHVSDVFNPSGLRPDRRGLLQVSGDRGLTVNSRWIFRDCLHFVFKDVFQNLLVSVYVLMVSQRHLLAMRPRAS